MIEPGYYVDPDVASGRILAVRAARRADAREARRYAAHRGWFFYEPKWDGFRAIVFRSESDVLFRAEICGRSIGHFPELHEALLAALPAGCVVDGEIVIATPHGLDFDALQLRLHPAASRVAKLAKETPAEFVAFDLLAIGGRDLRSAPQSERRAHLEELLAKVRTPVHLTPVTRDAAFAADWLSRFEGAGLDGVIAKPDDGTYEPGKRAMFKVKHARTADCVVAGFRWHKAGKDVRIGSLLLGPHDATGALHHVGVTSSFTMARRAELVSELAPLRKNALDGHPWRNWAVVDGDMTRMPGGQSRWSAGKDLSWEPLRIERVCEVKRSHARRSLSPRRGLPAVAGRQAADRLPLRPARGHDPLRAREGFRRASRALIHALQSSGASSGSSGSCAGRTPSGTC